MTKIMNFDGHRIYDGCPDSTMRRRWDEESKEIKRLISRLEEYTSKVSVTYFPAAPSGYLVFSNYKEVGYSERPHSSKIVALTIALRHVMAERKAIEHISIL